MLNEPHSKTREVSQTGEESQTGGRKVSQWERKVRLGKSDWGEEGQTGGGKSDLGKKV